MFDPAIMVRVERGEGCVADFAGGHPEPVLSSWDPLELDPGSVRQRNAEGLALCLRHGGRVACIGLALREFREGHERRCILGSSGRGADFFRGFVTSCVEGHHGSTSVALVGHLFPADDFVPRPVGGGCEVDPGDDAVPLFAGQFHIVVSCTQQAHKSRCFRMEFSGRKQVHVALDRRRAYVPTQGEIRRSEGRPVIVVFAATGGVNGWGGAEVGSVALAAVAGHAASIENGLDFACEGEPARRPIPRGNAVWSASGRGDEPGGRGTARIFMTAGAGYHLSRHGHEPTAHQLQRLAVRVQRLYCDWRVGRNAETRRAIRANRDRADDPFDVPRPIQPDAVHLAAHAMVGEVIGEQAK